MTSADNPSAPKRGQDTRKGGRSPDLTSSDPYAVLGLTRGAAPRQIKRAYFSLVREHPPENDPASFKLVRAAYEQLRTDKAKVETDLFLFQPPYHWEPRKRKRKYDLDVHAEDMWMLLQQGGDLGRVDFKDDYRGVPL
ncbi:MAG: DnaJ domain-containing protein [Chloroflexota bacterium]|nr:DnaJ domain-containing protein [Chloroflexota bacterium]